MAGIGDEKGYCQKYCQKYVQIQFYTLRCNVLVNNLEEITDLGSTGCLDGPGYIVRLILSTVSL